MIYVLEIALCCMIVDGFPAQMIKKTIVAASVWPVLLRIDLRSRHYLTHILFYMLTCFGIFLTMLCTCKPYVVHLDVKNHASDFALS